MGGDAELEFGGGDGAQARGVGCARGAGVVDGEEFAIEGELVVNGRGATVGFEGARRPNPDFELADYPARHDWQLA